ncbi:hypothetical protein BdWA1_000760 [Babesia duncani]|uniref:RNA-editing substrate-binding complex 6 protein domain-containing protein n=1 Tax=Babesia duncani TaxID=323732 RepID=A0AAD9UQD2_9APIC|nr:hypothetical protein BdWA1_000760 [Babesia duncani]
MPKVPNAFSCLHLLAKKHNFDPEKWRQLLVSVYRKRHEKQTIKDTCLLYYALSHGYKNDCISSLRVTFKATSKSDVVCSENGFGIIDVASAYMHKLCELINYMNGKQLSMVVHSLSILNMLDDIICNAIISRVNSLQLHISCRSLSTMALALTKCEHSSIDCIERILMKRIDELAHMNMFDVVTLCKILSITRISNRMLCDLVAEKVCYYTNVMGPSAITICFNFMSRVQYANDQLINSLYVKICNTLEQFNTQLLTTLAKSLARIKPNFMKEFCDIRLVPTYFNKIEDHKECPVNDILVFLIYSMKCGSTTFPILLHSIINRINDLGEWNNFFFILFLYGRNIREYKSPSDYKKPHDEKAHEINITTLWTNGIDTFLEYIQNRTIKVKDATNLINWCIESEQWNTVFVETLIKKIETIMACEPIKYIVDIVYNVHLNTINIDILNKEIIRRKNELDLESLMKFLSVQFLYGKCPSSQYLERLHENLNCGNVEISEQSEWELASSLNFREIHIQETWQNQACTNSIDLMEYLLHSMVFFYDTSCVICEDAQIKRENFNSQSSHLNKFKQEICYLIKHIKRNIDEVLTCIKIINDDFYKEIILDMNIEHRPCSDVFVTISKMNSADSKDDLKDILIKTAYCDQLDNQDKN